METANEIALEKEGTVFYEWNQPLILHIAKSFLIYCAYIVCILLPNNYWIYARKIIKKYINIFNYLIHILKWFVNIFIIVKGVQTNLNIMSSRFGEKRAKKRVSKSNLLFTVYNQISSDTSMIPVPVVNKM